MKITEYKKQYTVPQSVTPAQPADGAPDKRASGMFDWVQSFVVAIVVLTAVFTFVLRPVKVVGDSMLPTLTDGDWLLLSAFDADLECGEIIVSTQPNRTSSGEPVIKRVIATAGQTVDIDFTTGAVSVDGTVLNEPYIKDLTHRSFDVDFPLIVPEGTVFVMGDNRNDSLDSRTTRIGFINEDYILGSVKMRIFPFESIQYRTGTEE